MNIAVVLAGVSGGLLLCALVAFGFERLVAQDDAARPVLVAAQLVGGVLGAAVGLWALLLALWTVAT